MPTSRSATRKRATKPYSGAPTNPRLDLSLPEHVIRSLASWGRFVLAATSPSDEDPVTVAAGCLSDEDRATLERAVRQLYDAEPELFDLLRQVTAPAPILKRLVEKIGTIAGAAYLIGAHGAMTETSHAFFERSQTALMRWQRKMKASPEEQRLWEAIETEMKAIGETIPPKKDPYKTAGMILAAVNKRLAPRTVKIDVIYRRLVAHRRTEPAPRSSRTRRK